MRTVNPKQNMRLGPFDRRILNQVYAVAGGVGLVVTIVSPFVTPPCWILVVIVLGLLAFHCGVYRGANQTEEVSFSLCGTEVVIRYADLFADKSSLKVIAFNEYFDTLVDDKLISSNTINGKFLKQLDGSVSKLDSVLENDPHLQRCISKQNSQRPVGKKVQYKLGTAFKYNDYLLVAFSRFDEDNQACLSIEDYVGCLLNLWREIGMQYNGCSIAIPLMGAGITRIGPQQFIPYMELLEIMLWTLEKSKVKLAYGCKIYIDLFDSPDIRQNVNLFALKKSG
ncbi:MAG: hypothetical protein K2O45_01695 [Oscillospiraceae bacterium]|nr:hypothetical protein [Oscillospiraceae bacterium]